MNALSEDFWGTLDANAAAKGGLFVRETHWGFIARQDASGSEQTFEVLFKTVGLALIPVGAAMMFVLGELPLSGLLMANIGLPIAFVIVGLALYLHASRGFRKEIQVDSLNREVRIGTVNRQGSFHRRKTFAAREIDSAFLARSRVANRPSTLNLRLREIARPVALIHGPEAALQPLFERTAAALKAPKARRKKPSKRRRSLMSIPLWKKRAQTFDPQ